MSRAICGREVEDGFLTMHRRACEICISLPAPGSMADCEARLHDRKLFAEGCNVPPDRTAALLAYMVSHCAQVAVDSNAASAAEAIMKLVRP